MDRLRVWDNGPNPNSDMLPRRPDLAYAGQLFFCMPVIELHKMQFPSTG